MKFIIFTPALYGSIILLSGCVALPVPVEPETTEGKDVGWTQAYFKPNITTKQQVIKRCGQPTAIWVEANLYIYEWKELKGRLLWVYASYLAAWGGAEDIITSYMLLIQFDENDRVQRCELVRQLGEKSYGYGAVLRDWAAQSVGKSSDEARGHTE